MKKWLYKLPKTNTAPPMPEVKPLKDSETALLQELRELQAIKYNSDLTWSYTAFGTDIYGIKVNACNRNEEELLAILENAVNIKRKEIFTNKRINEIKAKLGIK